jgi:hypothetical protein
MPTTPDITNKNAEAAYDLREYKKKCESLFGGLKYEWLWENNAQTKANKAAFLRDLSKATTIAKAKEVTLKYVHNANLKGGSMDEGMQEYGILTALNSTENKLKADNVKDVTSLNSSNSNNPIPAVTPFPAVNTAINVVNEILGNNPTNGSPSSNAGGKFTNIAKIVSTPEFKAQQISTVNQMGITGKAKEFIVGQINSGNTSKVSDLLKFYGGMDDDGDGVINRNDMVDGTFNGNNPSNPGGRGTNTPGRTPANDDPSGTPTPAGNGGNGNNNTGNNGGASNIDNRTEEQKAKDLANLGAAYNDAEAKAASGDPSKLRELDAFFQVTRPEEQYSAEYNQLKTVRLISGDGPSLPGDTLQGNGSAVYAVNERGERFHVTQEMATKMRANGTWKEPENLSQAEVDGMKMRFALSDTSQIGAINKPAINGFMLVSGDAATTLGPETLTGNGAAVYAVNDKGERFHVTSAMAQEMRANNTWQQPIELSQASVDKMAFKGSFNSLTDFNNGTVTDRTLDIASPVATQTKPASGIGVQPPSIDPVPPQRGSTEPGGVRSAEFRDVNKNGVDDRDESTGGVRAGFIDEPRKPIASNPATPSTPGVSGAHVRNEQDSGFAYPWSAAKATGTTDVQGTIGKAVEFMNKHEGKNYKYDSIKGTIQAEDGSFISKNDVQSLNNIITKYHKTNFELPESAGAGVVAPQSVNLTYGGVGSPQRPLLGDVTNGAVRIGSAPQDGLYSPTSGGLAGNTPGVKTHPVEGGFNLP